MADRTDMIRKIQACMNLANDPGATEDEKRAAQDRAKILMTKYEIDEAMMFVEARDKGGDAKKDVVMTSFWIKATGDTFIPQQRMMLASCLARNMSCRAVIEEKMTTADVETGDEIPGGTYLTIVGFRSDVENAKNLYNLLVPDIALAVAKEKVKSENYSKQFAQGYVDEIDRRLGEMRRNVTKAVEADGKGMGLVLVKKGELVKDEFENRFPDLRPYKQRADSKYDPNAQARGRAAAQKADLGGGNRVGGGARKGIGS